MKYLILRVDGDDEGILENACYMIVEAVGLAEYLKSCMATVKKLQQKPRESQGLRSVIFEDSLGPIFIGRNEAEGLFGDKALDHADSGYVVVGEATGDPEKGHPEEMAYCALEVGPDWAFWVANPKHCEFDVFTPRVHDDDDMDVLEGKKEVGKA